MGDEEQPRAGYVAAGTYRQPDLQEEHWELIKRAGQRLQILLREQHKTRGPGTTTPTSLGCPY